MTSDEARKLLDDTAAAISEHFESVVIIATRSNPEAERYTELLTGGRGNWYAQRASMREVLVNDDAFVLADQIRKAQNGEGPGGP